MEKIPEGSNYNPEEVAEYKDRWGKLMLSVEDDDAIFEMAEKMASFAKDLKAKYPNVSEYGMWHVLGGSGIDEEKFGEIKAQDFPGDDSVRRFVESLEKEYLS